MMDEVVLHHAPVPVVARGRPRGRAVPDEGPGFVKRGVLGSGDLSLPTPPALFVDLCTRPDSLSALCSVLSQTTLVFDLPCLNGKR